MSWRDELRPASWRGIPFGVLANESRFGRRVAVHEYPFRDTVWVEDLGRNVRRLGLTGFLVGDDALLRKQEMIEACEEEGPGELVHPTLGSLTVALLEFAASERWDQGRVVELAFAFVEAAGPAFPDVGIATGKAVAAAADAADLAAADDFAARATRAFKEGSAAVRQVGATVGRWTATAQRLAGDATRAVHAVGALAAPLGGAYSYGRFFRGARLEAGVPGIATVSTLLTRATNARLKVERAVADVAALAEKL